MKTYVKIYGPPLVKAIQALVKIAAESPEGLITSYYDFLYPLTSRDTTGYYGILTRTGEVSGQRMAKLISNSGQTLGEHDFFFEWAENPSIEQLDNLLTKIDQAFAPLGCRYTATTK